MWKQNPKSILERIFTSKANQSLIEIVNQENMASIMDGCKSEGLVLQVKNSRARQFTIGQGFHLDLETKLGGFQGFLYTAKGEVF